MQKGLKTGPTSATREERSVPETQKRVSKSSVASEKPTSRMIHIRVWPGEEAAMRAAAVSREITLASFVRLSALHIAGAPTGVEFEAARLIDAIRHLDGAANNLNQLARAANKARGIVMGNRDRLVMIELTDRVEELRALFLDYRVMASKRPGQLILPASREDR